MSGFSVGFESTVWHTTHPRLIIRQPVSSFAAWQTDHWRLICFHLKKMFLLSRSLLSSTSSRGCDSITYQAQCLREKSTAVFKDPPESPSELQHSSLINHNPGSNFIWRDCAECGQDSFQEERCCQQEQPQLERKIKLRSSTWRQGGLALVQHFGAFEF